MTDIIVCVHNALDDVARCLDAVVRHSGPGYRLIFVDDGSDPPGRDYLVGFVQSVANTILIRNDEPHGYTKAANQGLRATTADFVVLLNSDTVVTPHWLDRLWECAASSPKIGLVGPLSNAASYQSIPRLTAAGGGWASNPLPAHWSIDDVAAAVAGLSRRRFPRVPLLNGFCLGIKRAVIERIGYLDEAHFPDGYGEENDYCLRAGDAGFELAVADHAFVYHAKSRSYSADRRQRLAAASRTTLFRVYGEARILDATDQLANVPALAKLRKRLKKTLRAKRPPVSSARPESLRVLFLLTASGGGGGAHSVVQEAHGMRRLGVEAQVAVRADDCQRYRHAYPTLDVDAELFYCFAKKKHLIAYASTFDVVVGTVYSSMKLVNAIVKVHPAITPAYYVQDYEPWFYEEDWPDRTEALASYTLVPGTVLFAKTDWLCRLVHQQHGVIMHKVSPSLDHAVFAPPQFSRAQDWPVRLAAMVRPRTPRRGAARVMRVLRRLRGRFGDRVEIQIFGCADRELDDYEIETRFAFRNHGRLPRERVAALLRGADIFLDLSDYQAFGRTGLEAMASGCAVVVPAAGGAGEYAVDRENALMVDTASEDRCFQVLMELITDHQLRRRLQRAGIDTAAHFSIEEAARSELELLARHVRRSRPHR